MTNLRQAIEETAKQENMSVIETISLAQAGAAKKNDTVALDALCSLKNEYIKKDFDWIA